ncbi:uncharacterized protein LOC131064857 [Cryptomeria japonica]|uniref:uncharacterized protein LOC131064857 n=1 Tax=Cryptomeria japonica TaxID=3369 RepID=UPI0027DA1EAF|nr:uncharacterized protein LOC131064857 [Cryptomeria japonica]
MDACHLLLGRPWKYDLKALNDGHKNTYSITKDEKVIELIPLPDNTQDQKEKEANILIMEGKEFLKAIKEEGSPCFTVMSVQGQEEEPILDGKAEKKRVAFPEEVEEMFRKYKDIVVEEFPRTLPPIREISHCIDFIPAATLPNKTTYKMTPQQNEEVARQIQELVDKGLIEKRLSPCAVPTVLAPKGTWRLCTDSRALIRKKKRRQLKENCLLWDSKDSGS